MSTHIYSGNTPAHLVLLEGLEVGASDSLYTASMEGMVETGALATITSLAISQVEQVQLCVLLYLFSRGARDVVNYYGQGVADLIEQGDMRKVFQEMVSRSQEVRGQGEGQAWVNIRPKNEGKGSFIRKRPNFRLILSIKHGKMAMFLCVFVCLHP